MPSFTPPSPRPSAFLRKASLRRPLHQAFVRVGVTASILGAIGYLATSAHIANQLTYTERQAQVTSPAAYGLPFEDVQIPSRDGLRLAGWFIPAPASQRAILLVHGKGSCRSCEFDGRFVKLASHLHTAGFNILMIDLRGHGQSQGSRFTMGEQERWDVLGAVDWLQRRGLTHIGALGVSLGGASVVKAAAAADGGEAIQAIVLDSVFGNLREVLEQEFPKASGLSNVFLPGSLLMSRILLRANLNAVRPVDDLPKIKGQLLLIFAEHDQLIPLAQFYAMTAIRPDAETWLVAHAEHAGAYGRAPDEYVARVTRFFDRALPEAEP